MLRNLVLAVAMLFTVASAAGASDFASEDEAKAMAEKAATHITSAGIDNAFKDFMTDGGEWHDRDLYVFVFNDKGTMAAHGQRASLVGRDMARLRDVDGKLFVEEFMKISDSGWVDYKWQNPATKAVELKMSYIVRVANHLVGVGAYKH